VTIHRRSGVANKWDDLAEWWAGEVEQDPAYPLDVHPMLLELMPRSVGLAMDFGCGEGQGMRLTGGDIFGCDLSLDLLQRADASGTVVQTELPDLGWLRDDTLDTAISVYLLDLIRDHAGFFAETARAVKPGGHLVVVINHPAFTAPGSCPMLDIDDEILWRWGAYFYEGSSTEPAGDGVVEFFHRPMDELLTSAAATGWVLERMIERGLSDETVARIPFYAGQQHIPRLLGVRWRRATSTP
jgi:SAM-dependent methyltransferase